MAAWHVAQVEASMYLADSAAGAGGFREQPANRTISIAKTVTALSDCRNLLTSIRAPDSIYPHARFVVLYAILGPHPRGGKFHATSPAVHPAGVRHREHASVFSSLFRLDRGQHQRRQRRRPGGSRGDGDQ